MGAAGTGPGCGTSSGNVRAVVVGDGCDWGAGGRFTRVAASPGVWEVCSAPASGSGGSSGTGWVASVAAVARRVSRVRTEAFDLYEASPAFFGWWGAAAGGDTAARAPSADAVVDGALDGASCSGDDGAVLLEAAEGDTSREGLHVPCWVGSPSGGDARCGRAAGRAVASSPRGEARPPCSWAARFAAVGGACAFPCGLGCVPNESGPSGGRPGGVFACLCIFCIFTSFAASEVKSRVVPSSLYSWKAFFVRSYQRSSPSSYLTAKRSMDRGRHEPKTGQDPSVVVMEHGVLRGVEGLGERGSGCVVGLKAKQGTAPTVGAAPHLHEEFAVLVVVLDDGALVELF